MPLKRIGIVLKPHPRATSILRGLIRWLRARGIEREMDPQTAGLAGSPGAGVERMSLAARCDLIIVVGGDGTLLSVARDIGSSRTPLLGVNLGSLGFLTEIPLEGLYPALEGILARRHLVQSRIRLRAEVRRGAAIVMSHEVLNDVVINKSALARILDINVEVNGKFMTVFKADGLIVCTPTGSTAYSLSAGGPIVDPAVDAMILCPICPHTLTNRPIVTRSSSHVEVGLTHNHGDVYVTIDGQVGAPFQQGDKLSIRRSRHPLRLIQFPSKDYFEVLRQKLRWGGRGARARGRRAP